MKFLTIYILAFIGGILLAIQAGFNAKLGSLLKQPILAVISTSISSAFFATLFFIFFSKQAVQKIPFQIVPVYLWLIGGLFSCIGISLYFYTIPKLGISRMITLGLCGQLFFSLVAGKFGWLNLPIEPITMKRFIGAIAMIAGIILINSK